MTGLVAILIPVCTQYGCSQHLIHIFTYVFCYSDPNTIETLKSFQDCIEWAPNDSFSDDDIDEAKLGVFSQVNTTDVIVPTYPY